MFFMNNYINSAGARSELFSSSGATDQTVLRFLDHTQLHARTPTHIHTAGRNPLNKWSARRRGRYRHNTQRRTYISSAGFEPAMPAILYESKF